MQKNDQRWYRQPVAWLGVAILAGSLAACIHLIVFALAHQDPPLPSVDQGTSFRIPATRQPAAAPASQPPAKP